MSTQLRQLTAQEIETFASRKGVKRIAVENFLMTVTANETCDAAFANVQLDAQLYGWNAATKDAIIRGIYLASKSAQQV